MMIVQRAFFPDRVDIVERPADGVAATGTNPEIPRLRRTQHDKRVYTASLGRGRGGVVEQILVDFVTMQN